MVLVAVVDDSEAISNLLYTPYAPQMGMLEQRVPHDTGGIQQRVRQSSKQSIHIYKLNTGRGISLN
jgi:hypothetical protein